MNRIFQIGLQWAHCLKLHMLDDTPMANVMEIRTRARRLQAEHGLGLIVIDYLQLMDGRAGE